MRERCGRGLRGEADAVLLTARGMPCPRAAARRCHRLLSRSLRRQRDLGTEPVRSGAYAEVPCLRQRSAPRASRGGASATAAGRFSSERRRVSRRAQLPGHSLVHKLEIGIMRRAPEPQQRSGCRLQCGCPRPAEEALGPRSAARQRSSAAHGKLPPLPAPKIELQPPAVRLALSSLISPYALRGWRCCRRAARPGTQHKGNGADARTREATRGCGGLRAGVISVRQTGPFLRHTARASGKRTVREPTHPGAEGRRMAANLPQARRVQAKVRRRRRHHAQHPHNRGRTDIGGGGAPRSMRTRVSCSIAVGWQ
jgi:hypothetical protein